MNSTHHIKVFLLIKIAKSKIYTAVEFSRVQFIASKQKTSCKPTLLNKEW